MSGDSLHRLVSDRITQKLSSLQNAFYEKSIFKVNDILRRHNKDEYEPEVVSIGPYHHGKYNLKEMETHKFMYLNYFLRRCGDQTVDRCIIALIERKDQARRYYAEKIDLSEVDFLEMMCLDGCFVIEFLIRWHKLPEVDQDDSILQNGWLYISIARDLLLIENQIPFFILIELFDMIKFEGQKQNFVNIALSLCHAYWFGSGTTVSHTSISAEEVFHLLDLVHKGWCSSFAARLPEIGGPLVDNLSLEYIKSTSELERSGIKFEMIDYSRQDNLSWLDITFDNGKIKIPRLTIGHATESVFRNLIAYEQYMGKIMSRSYITDYTTFLDRLIDSPRDVEKLRHCSIIKNSLNDDLYISTMFNELTNDVMINEENFCYKKVFEEVNKYYRMRRTIWKARCKIWGAHLMRNYFNSPWSIIKVLAAAVLLILTLLQTIFTIKK